ncbi:vacuolar protein sorting-associated protein 62 [Artemisia annua]|uniref:Vacuolar protein sorting-associated protein 62 n=1 Tax=Artemisia annua TaxID=35608 RepID=A0A2U1QE09_ARTAN|nr:vacuolar protein sorting-associated protein 62 [Artemisia annua]
MSSLRLCRLAVHTLCTILILQIVCNAYRPYNDFDSAEEKAISFDYPAGTGGGFAHETTDFGDLEGFKAKYNFKKDVYSGRPTIEQIKAMVSAYAPLIYFHPDEEYFPSSVSWFFKNGAQIVDSKPHLITNNGDNLPRNGQLDGAFLDLPSDQPLQDKVKKGSLTDAVAYIHANRSNGRYTDIIYVVYPFNGAAKLQVWTFHVPLERLENIAYAAPLIYFHPDEEYFPSSVSWFFKNGAQIVDSKPHLITNNGDNLPRNGQLDGAFLDLPSDQPLQDKVKKGSLTDAVAYIHAKPGVNGRYTDIIIWLYYPFNGAAKLQVGPFTVPLGKAGEHVSDWEHMRLRIDNVSGRLTSVYLSQHAKGKWLQANEFEYINGRPVVYASLHGHALYNAPVKTIHYNAKGLLGASEKQMLIREFKSVYPRKSALFSFAVGPVDEAAKSDRVFDILVSPSSYEIVSLDYGADNIVPPPWLDYTGRWGPTINLYWKEEAKMAIKFLPLPFYVKMIANGIVSKLPDELFAQEGPAGPKMIPSWNGDESE